MNRILLSFSCLLSVSAVIQAQSEFCGDGTLWDDASQTCVIDSTQFSCLTQPIDNSCYFDVSGNGVVGPEDLLSFLASFASTCEANLPPWSCGDPLEYQGYDYATVLIGEQCWFAENLRTEVYQNGDTIPGDLSTSQWSSANYGAQAIYNNESENLDIYGRLYNGFSIVDDRAICPANWKVPSDFEWGILEMELGMNESELLVIGERGDNQGIQLKSSYTDTPSWDGSNSSGFTATANGYRHNHGYYQHLGFNSHFWSQSVFEEGVYFVRVLQNSVNGIYRLPRVANSGYTVRCIQTTDIVENAPGCTDPSACNYSGLATTDDGSCTYAEEFYDCDGNCLNDADGDGVCDELEPVEVGFQCGDPLEYQGYDYATVLIGEQCWFAENVRAIELNDGTLISQGVVSQTPGLSYYNNDPSLGSIVGLHYNYWAALDVCPNDWHLPTDVEFNELMSFLNQQYPGAQVSGLVLKASEDAVLPWNGTNSTGFTGLPGGFISQNGMSYQYGADGGWWWTRNTLEAPELGHGFSLTTYNDMPVSVGYTQGDQGRSIRCIKD